jgi:hypothetical protein
MLRHNRIGALRPVREHEDQLMVEQRRLSDYDAAWGSTSAKAGWCHDHQNHGQEHRGVLEQP